MGPGWTNNRQNLDLVLLTTQDAKVVNQKVNICTLARERLDFSICTLNPPMHFQNKNPAFEANGLLNITYE